MKHALIQFGNEESYGLLFVGGELLEYDQEIRFFDGELVDVHEDVIGWKPDFIMFSPMTTFYHRALAVAKSIKNALPNVRCVFGGHHVMASPDAINAEPIDTIVIGPVRGSIDGILDGEVGVIKPPLTSPSDLPMPARDECYRDIPRLGYRYRKFVLSMLGCPWDCSYCSSSRGHMCDVFSKSDHKRYYLARRPLEQVLDEIEFALHYPTEEIEWVDDDIFYGDEKWLLRFADKWNKHIQKPMYVSTTSASVLKASDEVLDAFSPIVSSVGLGVQAARKESLKLFNRSWDNGDRLMLACDRLRSFGYSINLQCIVGLPVSDPVEDALETVMLMQKLAPGSIASCYPLQVYPGTSLEKYCLLEGIKLNAACIGDTNTGIPAIRFDPVTTKRLLNICKLTTLFVKYGIDERWMRALIDVDFDKETSKKLSEVRYHDCVVDRLNDRGREIFDNLIGVTNLRY